MKTVELGGASKTTTTPLQVPLVTCLSIKENIVTCDQHEAFCQALNGRQGFVVHHDTSAHTTEGFGSHARGSLFPLIHIGVRLGLIPLFDNTSLVRNRGRDYSAVGDVAGFLGFETRFDVASLADSCQVVDINTWTDLQIGSACGDASVLADMLAAYLESIRNTSKKHLLVILYGSFKYMDASVHVYEWLCERTSTWRSNKSSHDLHVAVHIRVPEEWCHSSWKEANSVDKFVETLDALFSIDPREFMGHSYLEVFTEEGFTSDNEQRLRIKFPHVVVHRGSSETILSDLRSMACADIFIASSSHFSAFAGYLCGPDCLIILANENENAYFEPHKKLGCRVFHRDHPQINSAIKEIIRRRHER